MGKAKKKAAAKFAAKNKMFAFAAKTGKYSPYNPNAKQVKKLHKMYQLPGKKLQDTQLLPVNIYIEAHSSREVTVHWMVKGLTENITNQWEPFMFHILVENTESKAAVVDEYIRDSQATKSNQVIQFRVPINLKPGRKYNFQVTACKFQFSTPEDLAHGSITHTPYLMIEELYDLMQRAMVFIRSKGSTIAPVKFLYRNKPKAYFERILKERNGIMEIYTKDWNGDPGCPINGQVDGLFFNTRTDPKTGKMPSFSPFGDTRILIQTNKLLTGNLNVYFADFYCLTNNHYVTLVLTNPGSEVDEFCASRLIALSSSDYCANPFFVKSPITGEFFCSTAVWVELLYTENVDISQELCDGKSVFYVRPIHGGSSTIFGKPKKPNCPICNLY